MKSAPQWHSRHWALTLPQSTTCAIRHRVTIRECPNQAFIITMELCLASLIQSENLATFRAVRCNYYELHSTNATGLTLQVQSVGCVETAANSQLLSAIYLSTSPDVPNPPLTGILKYTSYKGRDHYSHGPGKTNVVGDDDTRQELTEKMTFVPVQVPVFLNGDYSFGTLVPQQGQSAMCGPVNVTNSTNITDIFFTGNVCYTPVPFYNGTPANGNYSIYFDDAVASLLPTYPVDSNSTFPNGDNITGYIQFGISENITMPLSALYSLNDNS